MKNKPRRCPAPWWALGVLAFASAGAVAQSLQPRLLAVQPGGEQVALWALGDINEVPAFVRSARTKGQASSVCEPEVLVVQGEKFKLSGQAAEAAMVLAGEALHAHCKGEVWYAPAGQTRRLRADLRAQWHDPAGLRALQMGQNPQPLAQESLEFSARAGQTTVSVHMLELEAANLREHQKRWPTYQANLERLQRWKTRFGADAQVPLADWASNAFAHAQQSVISAVVFVQANEAQQVDVEAPRQQKPAQARLLQADAARWQPGAWLVVVQPQPPIKQGNTRIANAVLLDKQACDDFDCRDKLLIPGNAGLPKLWGKDPG